MYYFIILLFYYIIILLYDYSIVLLYHYIILLLYYYIIILLLYGYSPNRFHLRGSGGFGREPLVILPFRLGGSRIDFVARRGTW